MKEKLVYRAIPILDKKTIVNDLLSENKIKKLDAMLSLFTYNIDMYLAIKTVKKAIVSEDSDVRRIGILGVAYMIEAYDELTEEVALEILEQAKPICNDEEKDYFEDEQHMIKVRYHKEEKLSQQVAKTCLLKLFKDTLCTNERTEKLLKIQETISNSVDLPEEFNELYYKLAFYKESYKDSDLEKDLNKLISKYFARH
jgi:hypothetical protein